MKTSFAFRAAGIGLSLMFLCSCTTGQFAHRSLPANLPINQNAGRGGLLIVNVRVENGPRLPFVVDTGSDATFVDKSLEPNLGKPVGTSVGELAGMKCTGDFCKAPRLYLGGARLMMAGTNVVAADLKPLSGLLGRRVMGILGMDVLEHYCIQMDFAAHKLRFLNGRQQDKQNWGTSFPIVPVNARDARPAIAENLLGAQGAHSLIDSGYNADGWLMPMYYRQWTNDAVLPANGETRFPDGMFGGEKYPSVTVEEKDFPSDGIGLRFLARHEVTLDFPDHMLYLQRQSIGPLLDPKRVRLKPIPDANPQVTAHVRAMVQDIISGTAASDDYTAEAWKDLLSKQNEIQARARRYGDFLSLTLVNRSHHGGQRSYRYRLEFAKATLLAHFVFNRENKLASGDLETMEWKERTD